MKEALPHGLWYHPKYKKIIKSIKTHRYAYAPSDRVVLTDPISWGHGDKDHGRPLLCPSVSSQKPMGMGNRAQLGGSVAYLTPCRERRRRREERDG